MTRFFVYGSLLTSANHPLGALMRSKATLVGPGYIRARLYMIADPLTGADAYPGAVPSRSAADRVHGELYNLEDDPSALFKVLDDYENCSAKYPEPHEFQRRRVSVTLSDGNSVSASAYLYNWDVSRARRLASGRFVGPALTLD